MKKIFEFNLPEDREDFEIYSKAIDYYCAMVDIKDKIRSKLKYSELTEDEHKIWSEVSEMIHEILEERDLD